MKPNDVFKEKIDEEIKNREERKNQWSREINNGEFNQIDLEKANQLCHMLDPSRFTDRLVWRNLGLALYSISGGHQEGFQLWELISEKMDPEAFTNPETSVHMRNIWQWASELDNCAYTMGSLKWWAQQDSPTEYEEWRRNTNRSLTELAIKVFNEGALADLAFELYGKEFQYTTASNWFRFMSDYGHWKRDPYDNSKWIQNVFRYELKTYIREYIRGEEHLSDCFKNIQKLGTKSLINNCVAMAKSNFSTDEMFEDKLDQNPYLIGDLNGVYDLQTGTHRHGTPEDYVSMRMGAYYRDYNWEHPDVKSVMRFWSRIHVDPKIRRFFLKAIAVCMVAGNIEKVILVMTNATGNNGKSACLKIIEQVWGDYSITLQRERFVVQTAKSAGAAAPDIANARNKRMGSVKELSKDETLDIGALKLFSGSDDIQVRTLYKEGGNMQILLTMILMLNKLPAIPSSDTPTWNRLRIIPFESTFDDNAPSDPREQWMKKHFKPDKDIKPKLDKLKDAFYWVFLQYFKIYQVEGMYPLPEKVKVATQNYRDSNNIFEQFLKSSLVETLDKKDSFKVSEDLFNDYMGWFTLNTKGKRLIPPKYIEFKKNVIDYFKNKKTKVGETQKGSTFFKYVQTTSSAIPTIHGVKIREISDDAEEQEKKDNVLDESYSDVDGAEFYNEDITLKKDKYDEDDYRKYFEGPMFVGLDDSEMSNILLSNTL